LFATSIVRASPRLALRLASRLAGLGIANRGFRETSRILRRVRRVGPSRPASARRDAVDAVDAHRRGRRGRRARRSIAGRARASRPFEFNDANSTRIRREFDDARRARGRATWDARRER
jgi:hypothetical protein